MAGAGAGPSGVKNFEHNHYGEMGFTEAGATVYCPPQPFIAYLPPPFSKPHYLWWDRGTTGRSSCNIQKKNATVTMLLPVGIHYYCFIVDGELKCASNLQWACNHYGDHYNILYLQEDVLLQPPPANDLPDLSEFDSPPSPPSSYDNSVFTREEFYRVDKRGVERTIEPPELPPELEEALVNMRPRPHFTQLNHLYSCKKNEDQHVMLNSTERFGDKFVTAALKHLKQVQAFLFAVGHSQTQFYAFKLVRFCALSLANLPYARLIFDHLHSPNVYLYTAMITAYASRDHHSAFLLYRHMLRRGHPCPNHFVYPHLLKSCPHISHSHATQMVHTQILKSGFLRYPVVETALLDSYSRLSSHIASARQVFDEMSDKNVVSWTAMISGCTRLGDIRSAISLFENMPDRDVPAWNALIAGCTQNGFFSEAISLFRRMINLAQHDHCGNRPNKVTVVCALSACGHTGMLQLGKWIHGYVYKNRIDQDTFISNAFVDIKSAITMFEEMMQCEDDVKPDEVTFVGLLNACTHGGLVEKGFSYFELMTRDYRIEPRIEHYGCLIDLLGRAGRFEEAMEVVRGMSMEPDEVVWGSLLNGCKIHGRTDLAEFTVQKLIEIDPNNGGYGIMLANIYGELGKWDEVRKVRKNMKDQNVYKTPGCSWIEVDNQVYQFYSVDKSHYRTEEIYKILESLLGFIGLK
uniref:Association with the SNF1 complex (ASC) domain-containing protein n=1 Tax=Fagus sylvatica TaxID=28930 RepID=A0A2N9J7S1_FAGSY